MNGWIMVAFIFVIGANDTCNFPELEAEECGSFVSCYSGVAIYAGNLSKGVTKLIMSAGKLRVAEYE